jgi:RNA-binding protein
MALNNADKKRFRQIGHSLNPIITIAEKGLSENVRLEIERALKDHELIKVKLVCNRDEKKALSDTICADFDAECVQSIGHVLLLYKPAKKPDPKLSNILRNAKV